MPTFEDIAKKFNKFSLNEALSDIFKAQNIQKMVLDTIRQRIELSGVTGSNKTLKTDKARGGNPYSDFTMDIKDFLGQSIANVTLKDTGDFYSSFKFVLNLFGFELEADFDKKNGHIAKNFTNMYGSNAEFEEDVLSLTDDEIDKMIEDKILPELNKKINESLYIS